MAFREFCAAVLIAALAQGVAVRTAAAESSAPPSVASSLGETQIHGKAWLERRQTRCDNYRDAFAAALTRFGRRGLSDDFIRRSDTFVASNCAGERDVCPRSPEELQFANLVIVRAMAAKHGTFMPFACKTDEARK